ncbi:MAG TPA: HAD family hydrolase [Candidatus Polarisedimenticolia bacterium]|nr:HAD family hydrolase [Candidatus Polarisedimenticolia bacterium]
MSGFRPHGAPGRGRRARRAVFLDKDGTLVEDLRYNADPARIRAAPGAAEALRRMHAAGFLLVVVSNQAGIALGLFSESAMTAVRSRIESIARDAGAELTDFRYCPHHPEGRIERFAVACACRKPEPGMILDAAREHGIDLAGSWLIGDILDDVEAGRRAGCTTILLENDNETEWRLGPYRFPHWTAADLQEAATIVTRHARGAA